MIKQQASNAVIVGFKLESDESHLIERAKNLRSLYDIDVVIANTIQTLDKEDGTIWIVDGTGKPTKCQGKKSQLADDIYDTICSDD
jgi:phosphopantothenoylcysteine synthetase/decarboxylase